MRVIVCGSRRWRDRQKVADRLFELPVETMIVVGYNPLNDTPKGADRIAYQEAQKLGLKVEPHPAQWDRYGVGRNKNPAGFIRNKEMAQAGASLCIAFWDGFSTGTEHMMGQARLHGIPVEVIRPDHHPASDSGGSTGD